MKNEERLQIKDCGANTTKIKESVQKWSHSIECGIFKPETMPYTPFAKKCILDTCIQGFTPRIYKKSIEEWVTILSKATRNVRASKDIKEELNKFYKEFRQAIYIRAFTLQRLNRQLVANREKELANKLKTPVEYAHTTKKTQISWKFGSGKEPPENADINSEHEQEQQNAEEQQDHGKEQRDNSAKPNTKAAKRTKKKVECTHIRRNIAKMERRKTGTTNNKHLQCNMCKHYNKDNLTLEKIEKKILHHANDADLHKIIQHSSKK